MARTDSIRRTKRDAAIIDRALRVLEQEVRHYGASFTSPDAVRDYLRLQLVHEQREVFMCLFLNSQNQLVDTRRMFEGTLTETSVYPREIVKAALIANAASVIFAHNHPGGDPTPSMSDKCLTKTLAEALALIDVKALDHFIVATGGVLSFAELGLMA